MPYRIRHGFPGIQVVSPQINNRGNPAPPILEHRLYLSKINAIRVICALICEIPDRLSNHRNKSSQGFNPVCFLNAVEKWEMEE